MGVSKNSGTPKSSILIDFSIINHPFWGTPIFGSIHIQNLVCGLQDCLKIQLNVENMVSVCLGEIHLMKQESFPTLAGGERLGYVEW